jgi:tryptophan-rich sensory protein
MTKKILGFAFWVGFSYSAGLIELLFTPDEWALTLKMPGITPPGWIFTPLWAVLYFMMGAAAWLVWKQGGFRGNRLPLAAFIVQLILNGLWTVIYFGAHNLTLALGEMIVLDAAVVVTLALFWKSSRRAAVLLVPYLGWLLFTTYLIFRIWQLNVPG